MKATMISVKVRPELLARIDAEALELGLTRTALLLRPWKEPKPAPQQKRPA